ncbi:TPA: hypothetical protein U5D93_003219 [Yersinia enterocolitica]|uniref:CS1 type fimbrial major subunit n=1 Tax=Yersinia enterocolitica TaxID=630 RepID=UPI002AC66A66|nr:hypothetical protein [Yersinia enterocolitica]HDL8420667.1 hypothetical protein [Yersinia enterocolitica]HEN3302654.1 hypothetical protein [Yersinia enterocolitica]HEN3393114.1 hypothetical protein [Yersinia enterocolitica]
MKKTLLSIMTMAILASGSANAAQTMSVNVTAEIPTQLSLTDTNDATLSSAKLIPTATFGEYEYKQQIKIKGNSINRHFNVQITTPFTLLHSVDSTTGFSINTVSLGTSKLQDRNGVIATSAQYSKTIGTGEAELELIISATEPTAKTPGTYSGVLSLEIEETA